MFLDFSQLIAAFYWLRRSAPMIKVPPSSECIGRLSSCEADSKIDRSMDMAW